MTERQENIDVEDPGFQAYFEGFVDALIKHKVDHNGRLPYDLWRETLRLIGEYPCLEILVTDRDGNLYLKKRDDPNESEWHGKLHVPGIAMINKMRGSDVVGQLLTNEIVNSENLDKVKVLSEDATLAGLVWYDEPERNTTALTSVFEVVVDDTQILQDGFVRVTPENIYLVIDQHKPTVAWYQDGPNRLQFISP